MPETNEPQRYIRITEEEYNRLLANRNELAAIKLHYHQAEINAQNQQLLNHLIDPNNPEDPAPPRPHLPLTKFLTNGLTPTTNDEPLAPGGPNQPGGVPLPPPTDLDGNPLVTLEIPQSKGTLGTQPTIPSTTKGPQNIIEAITAAAAQAKENSRHHTQKKLNKLTNKPFPYAEIYHVALDYIPPSFPHPVNDQSLDVIMTAVELGVRRKAAFAMGGIPHKTYNTYHNRAKQGIEPYTTLFELCEIAEARVETRLVGHWQQAAQEGNWQAAERLLAKRFQEDWGDRRVVDLTLKDLMQLDLDELAEIAGEDIIDVTPTPGATLSTDTDAPATD